MSCKGNQLLSTIRLPFKISLAAGLTILFYYWFIYGRAGSLLLLRPFSSCGEQGLLSRCSAWASHCGGFSCCGAQAVGYSGTWPLGSRTQAQSLWLMGLVVCGTWDLPRSGINLCPLQCQADSLPLSQQRSPWFYHSIPVPKADFLPEIVCFIVGQWRLEKKYSLCYVSIISTFAFRFHFEEVNYLHFYLHYSLGFTPSSNSLDFR